MMHFFKYSAAKHSILAHVIMNEPCKCDAVDDSKLQSTDFAQTLSLLLIH